MRDKTKTKERKKKKKQQNIEIIINNNKTENLFFQKLKKLNCFSSVQIEPDSSVTN